MYRRKLDSTRAAKLFVATLTAGLYLQVIIGLTAIVIGVVIHHYEDIYFGAAAVLLAPLLWAHLIVIPLVLARIFIIVPKERRLVKQSSELFVRHPGIKIAVLGSYGKTTMKELLHTVLSEGKIVAATPANNNVTVSHAQFIKGLAGDEDVLIIEYGEGKPGDIARFAHYTKPTHAIITGIAPAHLDQYKNMQAIKEDIFSITKYVDAGSIYINGESIERMVDKVPAKNYYDRKNFLGWKVSDVQLQTTGTKFCLTNGNLQMAIHSKLVGEHLIGPLVAVVVLAHELGLTKEQILSSVAKVQPHEHRMQPYELNGAWIIDDTYNGNLEGIRAGTQLLHGLKAKRKIYVTPGLVDQGRETETVHNEVGLLIAKSNPDIVVLIQNSVTDYIKAGLMSAGYKGKLQIEPRPLEFYTNLSHFVAAGDLVVMQNDWTDNYA
jgi:UDP-N-acetylmuramoyl-tripeptide--D-alanyl-D-alanine ligase